MVTKRELIKLIEAISLPDDALLNVSIGDGDDGGDIYKVDEVRVGLHPGGANQFCLECVVRD